MPSLLKMSGIRFSDAEREWLETKSKEETISLTSIVRSLVRKEMKESK